MYILYSIHIYFYSLSINHIKNWFLICVNRILILINRNITKIFLWVVQLYAFLCVLYLIYTRIYLYNMIHNNKFENIL